MTGPLAPLFAILDKAIGCAHPVTSDEHDAVDEAPAALSSIERHVQDMARREEQLAHALSWYDDHKSLTGNYDGEMWGDLRDVEYEYERDSAALPARQKGEE